MSSSLTHAEPTVPDVTFDVTLDVTTYRLRSTLRCSLRSTLRVSLRCHNKSINIVRKQIEVLSLIN